MKTAVLDYDVGNLASVCQGLKRAGLDPFVTRDLPEIRLARAVVLPGVGAFATGMDNLRKYGLLPVINEIVEKGVPFLGICLGMQLLFEESDEHGRYAGLSLLPGRVARFPEGLKIPHMGWNTLNIKKSAPLMQDIEQGSYVYFVHSYYVQSANPAHIVATTEYGLEFPAVVCCNNIMGLQFHPEKSSRRGLQILENFGRMVRNGSYTGN